MKWIHLFVNFQTLVSSEEARGVRKSGGLEISHSFRHPLAVLLA